MENLIIDEKTLPFRKIAMEQITPATWKYILLIALYKGEWGTLDCSNHRGLRMLEQDFKIYEKVLDTKLQKITRIEDHRFGFTAEKSTLGKTALVYPLSLAPRKVILIVLHPPYY